MTALLLLVTACVGGDAADRSVASADPRDALAITTAGEEDGCSLVVQGQRVTSEQFTKLAKSWPNRRAILTMAPGTQYRCVGGVVFTLQRFGFDAQIIDVQSGPRGDLP